MTHDGPASGPVWILTNLPAEGIAEIQMPRIFGRDRAAFVDRQLASHFPDTHYRVALSTRKGSSIMDHLAPPRLTALGVDAQVQLDTELASLAQPLAGVWATSMLLAQIGGAKSMASETFVVLPDAQGLRIVVVKDGVSVMTRVIPDSVGPSAQAGEIIRTLRHLENVRVFQRTQQPRAVLVLGNADGMAQLLEPERLFLADLPSPWHRHPPADWRFVLFDLACRSPAGQLAPPRLRARFVADRLRKVSYVAAAASLAAGLWMSADNAKTALADRSAQLLVQNRIQAAQGQVEQLEAGLSRVGVSPALVLAATALDRDEIGAVRPMTADMQRIGEIVGRQPALRLGRLTWAMTEPGRPVCAGENAPPESAAVTPPAAGETAPPARMVEIQFEAVLPDRQKETERARLTGALSAELAQMQGATLVRNPVEEMAQAVLSGGDRLANDSRRSWCVALPASGTAAAPQGGSR